MINDDDYQAAMVSWLIDLGKDFAVETLAEGVETNAQAMMLSGLGCDSAQGYFFGRPMPAEDVAEFIAQWTAGTATEGWQRTAANHAHVARRPGADVSQGGCRVTRPRLSPRPARRAA